MNDNVKKEKPELVAKMRATKDQTSFCHDGDEYEVKKDGTIEIPGHLATLAESHGFERIVRKGDK